MPFVENTAKLRDPEVRSQMVAGPRVRGWNGLPTYELPDRLLNRHHVVERFE